MFTAFCRSLADVLAAMSAKSSSEMTLSATTFCQYCRSSSSSIGFSVLATYGRTRLISSIRCMSSVISEVPVKKAKPHKASLVKLFCKRCSFSVLFRLPTFCAAAEKVAAVRSRTDAVSLAISGGTRSGETTAVAAAAALTPLRKRDPQTASLLLTEDCFASFSIVCLLFVTVSVWRRTVS